MSGDEDFLSRWSRRKQDGAASAPVPEPPAPAPPLDVPQDAVPEEELSDEEILADLGLKHPDQLLPGDDIKGFLQDNVPRHLRRLALRQLWRSNPLLANLDELVDYGEDFTDSATVVENLQTLYQVGKGMFYEPAPEDDPTLSEVDSPEIPSDDDAAAPSLENVIAPEDDEGQSDQDAPQDAIPDDMAAEDGEYTSPPRRMTFRFDDA